MSETTMTPQGGSGELNTVSQAANALESLFDTPEDLNEQPQGEVEEQVQAEEVEAEPQEAEAESESEDTQDESDNTDQEEEPKYVVKAAGEEKEVPLSELIKGYQLGADYTKKTTEVAEQRKAVEAERQAIEEAKYARDSYAQRLQAIDQLLSQSQPRAEDLQYLKENDPIGYAVKVAELSEQKEQLAAVRAEQNRIANEQQSEQAAAIQNRIAQEAAKLAQVLPEFSDKVKGENLRKEIRSYGKELGFTDEELGSVYDSRHVLTLHKAMMYDKLQKAKPSVTKKVSQAPKMLQAGTGGNKVTESDVVRQQSNRLRQSGKISDAASVLEQFL